MNTVETAGERNRTSEILRNSRIEGMQNNYLEKKKVLLFIPAASKRSTDRKIRSV